MSAITKVKDWEVWAIGRIGGVSVTGGGIWIFKFRSQQAGVDRLVIYSGIGFGLGGIIIGTMIPNLTGQSFYTPMNQYCFFSLNDLDRAMGCIDMTSASLMVGYSLLSISAWDSNRRYLFQAERCQGASISGFGANIIATDGIWKVL